MFQIMNTQTILLLLFILILIITLYYILINRIKRAYETYKDFKLWDLFTGIINRRSDYLFKFVLKHPYISVIVFSIIGLSLSLFYNLTMDKDTWFWFFSTIAQTLAAFIALIAIFFLSRVELYNSQIHNKYEILRTIINDIITDKESK